MSEDGAWRDAWVSALDELELTLEQTERLLAGDESAEVAARWTPPLIEAPLPADILERAQTLLARQRQMIERTAVRMTGQRKTMDLVGRMAQAGGRAPARPVYVDLSA